MLHQRELLSNFEHSIQRRIADEERLRQFTTAPDQQEVQLRAALSQLTASRDAQLEAVNQEYTQSRDVIQAEFDHQLQRAEAEHLQTMNNIETSAVRSRTSVEQKKEDSTWIVNSVLDDSADDSPARIYERFKAQTHKSREDQTAEWERLNETIGVEMAARHFEADSPTSFPDPPIDRESAAERFAQSTRATRAQLSRLGALLLPRLFQKFRSVLLFFVLAALIALPVYFYGSPEKLGFPGEHGPGFWLIAAAGIGGIASLLFTLVLYTLASMKQSEILRVLVDLRGEVYWAHQHWLRFAKEQLAKQQKDFELQQRKIKHDRGTSLSRYEQAHEQKLAEIVELQKEQSQVERRRYAEEHAGLNAGKREALAELDRRHEDNLAQVQQTWGNRIDHAERELGSLVSTSLREQQGHWAKLKRDWEKGRQEFEAGLRAETQRDRESFSDWSTLAAGTWQPSREIPRSIRVGEYQLDLNRWPGAVSADPRLAPRTTQYQLPFALPFPDAASVLFKSSQPAARATAIAGLQCLTLRLLTLLPPGKLRFTIIDPVGLGESFGGLMHLADYDEMLVTSRIWTEANQIEARLADLTEHMENVLQKYLRNEFQTIEEYNASAGEVAEPYHVLVISDFPAKFSEIAARRLTSIVNSGPRCGVYTLMNCDPKKQLPNNFSLSDIEPRMSRFEWHDDAFYASDSPLPAWPITIDTPPAPEEFTAIVKRVGEASKDARRVEVSFGRITPSSDRIWTGDSRSELVIPLGRAGATKLQQLRLGKGTSQHMLVAGKTGSGKSTFLHILITNLALYYSPEEVNFVLIDFKKGVEFKDYATHQLPHARIIAVESDREFGVSALMKLGDILQERGEMFRRHGVQDIAGYRNATSLPLPRVLLVVDEFQEFFVEDDKISQNAALLLDRLVRQGRAFGIHVILGSQTLGGAYSLARSTLGQVAVRVALQCSEADAHLILSEDNTAARLLTRPGEAIYNDANGMVEGNHPFQIAWITDGEREAALTEFQRRLQSTPMELDAPIVFEGNIPSDLTRNPAVAQLVREYPTRSQPVHAPTIWLGDAVEIAPATSITLHRQSGANILLAGQDGDAALGVMGGALATLAASLSPQQEMNSLFVLDGSHSGSVEAEQWSTLVGALPVDVRQIRPNEVSPFLQAMTAELQRREEENDTHSPPVVLFVYHIARFRDLRKAEDDFGMGGFGGASEKPPEPGKMFADLLSRGPAFGIHAIIWCDSYNNVDRWFSRQTMRELEYRIVFQMNAADSSNLIDSPAASRLGTHRALLHREESGTAEKFRPYGMVPARWIDWLRASLLNEINTPYLPAPLIRDVAPQAGSQPARRSPEGGEGIPSSTSAPSAGSDEDSELPNLEEFTIQ